MFYDQEKCGARIRQIRKQNGYTQERLAEELNMDRSVLSRVEAGKYVCGVDFLAHPFWSLVGLSGFWQGSEPRDCTSEGIHHGSHPAARTVQGRYLRKCSRLAQECADSSLKKKSRTLYNITKARASAP